ncbi:MAG: helix-turn-helix domain-containing protein [Heliobacteriaceae bacterium]|nr:helix-turn-helix domain-containing protein [Heliobacteriaceae bacterium]MDD4586962.1 helix-turn-helix domain-containing protein [Heliobacteriaceae bacterium]
MADIGLALREAREQQRISLRQVENDTNIRIHYLVSLEEDVYEELPGRVYAIGFLRSYAKYLGLDAESLVEELKREWRDDAITEPAPVPTAKRRDYSGKPKNLSIRLAGYSLAAVAFAALVFVAVTLSGEDSPVPPDRPISVGEQVPVSTPGSNGNQGNGAGLVTPEQEHPENTQSSPGTETAVPAEEFSDGVVVTLQVRQDRSWMAVTQDGVPKFQGSLKAGETISFRGKEKVFVHVGNAGVVEVILNGKNIGPMGDLNQVVKKEFVRS